MFWKSLRSLRKLIPWYINGSLSTKEQDEVGLIINKDDRTHADFEAWKQIHALVTEQEQHVPSAMVRQRIMASLHAPSLSSEKLTLSPRSLFVGALLTLSILILLWLVVQPGVVLQWSLERDGMAGYRIYRASEGSSQFELIKEIPAQSDKLEYRYDDTLLVPGRNYTYRVEGIHFDGVTTLSSVVSSRFLEVLPGQLALILTSLIIGYGIVIAVQCPWFPKRNTMGQFA